MQACLLMGPWISSTSSTDNLKALLGHICTAQGALAPARLLQMHASAGCAGMLRCRVRRAETA